MSTPVVDRGVAARTVTTWLEARVDVSCEARLAAHTGGCAAETGAVASAAAIRNAQNVRRARTFER